MIEKTAAFRQRRAADMRACRKRQSAGIALFYVAADETTFEMMKRFGGLDPNRVRLGEHGIDIVDGRPIRPPRAALYWWARAVPPESMLGPRTKNSGILSGNPKSKAPSWRAPRPCAAV